MASPSVTLEKILDNLICPICHDSFKDPRTLSCSHVACKICLQRWVAVRTKLVCPQCNTERPLPPEGVDGLPRNFLISKICEDLSNLSTNGNGESLCTTHNELLTRICEPCLIPVCQMCATTSHLGHACYDAGSAWKFIRGKVTEVSNKLRSKQEETLIALGAFTQMKHLVEKCRANTDKEISDYSQALIKKVKENEVKLKSHLSSLYNAKMEDLETNLERVAMLDKSLQEALRGIDEIEIATKTGQPGTLNSLTTQMFEKIKHLHTSDIKLNIPETVPTINFKPYEGFDISKIGMGDVALRSFKVNDVIMEYSNFPEGAVFIKTNQMVRFQLKIMGADKELQPVCLPQVTILISSPSGIQREIGTSSFSKGIYSSSYFTPTNVGRYCLEIRCFNIPVKNSQRELLVKPNLKLQRDLMGTEFPWQGPSDIKQWNNHFLISDIARNCIFSMPVDKLLDHKAEDVETFLTDVNSRSLAIRKRSVLVCDPDANAVLKYDIVDKHLAIIYRNISGQPAGIAVDSLGNTYITYSESDNILIYDDKARLSGQIGSEADLCFGLKRPDYLCINAFDEMIIADRGNNRLVVYNIQTKTFVRAIPLELNEELQYCCGITTDSVGNIYITSCSVEQADKVAVMVFSRDGEVLTCVKDSLKDDVDGLCISNDNTKLYVTGRESGCVSCFTVI